MTDFRLDGSVLDAGERIINALRSLYAGRGYVRYKMSKFEEYDLYAKNKDFLISDNVITFTDTSGRLMALKPDVTLSIIKNSKDEPDTVRKVYYNENVYRVGSTGTFCESMQAGVECFGSVSDCDAAEVMLLAAESLALLSDDWMLDIADISLTAETVGACAPDGGSVSKLFKAVGEKNLHEIRLICGDDGAERLTALLSCEGSLREKIASLPEGISRKNRSILEKLAESPFSDRIRIDFSVTADANYYNGLVFKGFVNGVPDEVLSGGMYGNLMQRMHRRSDAVGFAVFTDRLQWLGTGKSTEDDGFVNVALPKGRLGEKVYGMFANAGFDCPSILENNRRLVFENAEKKIRFFWVKPSDVAIYVERGAADIGVAGKDILLEHSPDVYELLDLGVGKCRMAVAAPKDFVDDPDRTLRVATKFTSVTRDYYAGIGREIDVIRLNGSIELAPILGLSDVIVDIVETGTTLRENDLEVFETVFPISARLISNKASYKFKNGKIAQIAAKIGEIL